MVYRINRYDVGMLLFTGLLAAVLFLLPWLGRGQGQVAEICFGDGEVCRLPLSWDTEKVIESRGYHLTVTVKSGRIAVTESDCEEGLCRATPAISSEGQTIVCAPAGVVIRIRGEEAPDGVVG